MQEDEVRIRKEKEEENIAWTCSIVRPTKRSIVRGKRSIVRGKRSIVRPTKRYFNQPEEKQVYI